MHRPVLLFLALTTPWVSAFATPSAADTARLITQMSLDPDACYRITDVNFFKEDLHIYLTSGYITFAKPVDGKRLAAVFTNDIEAGDAEILLIPPDRSERLSLANFTGSPNLEEHFKATVMIFTDSTAAEIESEIQSHAERKNAEMGALFADRYTPTLRNLTGSFLTRLVHDVLTADPASGMFYMGLSGTKLGNFDVLYDPLSREQIVLGQLAARNATTFFDTWTSFTGVKERRNPSLTPKAPFTLDNFRIEATINPDLSMSATTRVALTAKTTPGRALSFWISRQMHITEAQVDGVAAEVFQHESLRENLIHGSDNEEILVVLPDTLDASQPHEILFRTEGTVITKAGQHIFFVSSRGVWYPRVGTGFAHYEMTFHYPRDLVLVSTGDPIADRVDGDWRITQYHVPSLIRFAGFNLGSYNCVSRDRDEYKINVCANREVEASLKQLPPLLSATILHPEGVRHRPEDVDNATIPSSASNPAARLALLAEDVSGAMQFMTSQFGPPPLRRLTVSPIPGGFGQGFPGLIYLSTLSYLDPTQRPAGARNPFLETFFSDVLDAHEVAHQWWGNLVTTDSYQDDWIMEALADYSALMYLEKKKGPKALETVLDRYRNHLLEKNPNGQTVESSGPITWGVRLVSSHSPESWRLITYEKGAWIIHMIRMRLGDERFLAMLRDICDKYRYRPLSTEEFRECAQRFAAPKSPDSDFRLFFENWVYGTGIPTIKLIYSQSGTKITGTLTTSLVAEDFLAFVPIEIQQGKQKTLYWLRASDDGTPFTINLRQPASAATKVNLSTSDSLILKK